MRYVLLPLAYFMLGLNTAPVKSHLNISISKSQRYRSPAEKIVDFKKVLEILAESEKLLSKIDSLPVVAQNK